MTRICVSAAALAVGCCLAAFPALGRAPDAAPKEKSGEPFVVHEWGTFSTFSGSAGAYLKFHPDDRDLPSFVHSRQRYIKGGLEPVIVSLETPVLFFYSERARTVSVRANFPKGQMTEWYPQVSRPPALVQQSLTWENIQLSPRGHATLRKESRDSRYYAARETDAVPLQVAAGEGRTEQEKFLFYRGVGDFSMPLSVRALGRGAFKVKNTGKDALPAVLLLNVQGGKVRFKVHDHLSPGAEMDAEEPSEESTADKLGAAVVELLTREGLYEKEARAMVKTWSKDWFAEDGTRLLYLVPASLTNELLPLEITPKPESLVRVLVGRHDILTPEREREVDALVKKLQGASNAEARVADEELKQLGRYRWAAQTAALARVKGTPARSPQR